MSRTWALPLTPPIPSPGLELPRVAAAAALVVALAVAAVVVAAVINKQAIAQNPAGEMISSAGFLSA